MSGSSTIFLLSPAQCGSERARMLTNAAATFPLAQQLRSAEGAGIGDVFAFLSSLYFRGKLAYSRRFARVPKGRAGVLVITPGFGLVPEAQRIRVEHMRAFADVDVHHANERYVAPLIRDARTLAAYNGSDTKFVLLGSIASAKYATPLLTELDSRLYFPADFVGRGDMSRGGLLLRCANEGRELEYVPVAGATLHGKRPPKLERLPRRS